MMAEMQGQPEDNLGCPCLLEDIQCVTVDKDSRTTCWGRGVVLHGNSSQQEDKGKEKLR